MCSENKDKIMRCLSLIHEINTATTPDTAKCLLLETNLEDIILSTDFDDTRQDWWGELHDK